MSSITSKYAVPFVNRRSTVIDNVLTRTLIYNKGNSSVSEIKTEDGKGYLRIVLPSLPLTQNCIGFKINVVKSDSTPLFEGYISGSSSDGYQWLYASSQQSSSAKISNKTTVFCYQILDPNNKDKSGNILKSIYIGDEETIWGTDVTVSIEYVSATLETNPDGNSDSEVIRTASINELSKVAEYNKTSIDDSPLNYTEGWRFEIVSGINDDDIKVIELTPFSSRGSSDIILTGVISGEGKATDDGSPIQIPTSFTGDITLRESSNGRYYYIEADGSKLVNLDKNPTLTGLVPESCKQFTSSVILENSSSSDVTSRFSFQGPGTYQSSYRVNKFTLGEWSSTNTKLLTVKHTNKPSNINLPLNTGELGLYDSGDDSDLYVGTTGSKVLVGGMKICSTDDELDSIKHFKGKTVFHNGVIKVSDGKKWVPMILDSSGVIISMDSIDDGEFYKKVNSNSVTPLGNISQIATSNDGKIISSNSISSHLDNNIIHVTQEDRNRWNAYSESTGNTYTKSEVNDLLNQKSNVGHYHFYHDPVNYIIESEESGEYPYPNGNRILIKSSLTIKVSTGAEYGTEDSLWIEGKNESFERGSVVVNLDDYKEYINKNGSISVLTEDIVTNEELVDTLKNYITGDKSYALKTENWSLLNQDKSIINSSGSSLDIGYGYSNLSISSANKPTYNGKTIMVDGDVDESKFAKSIHYHRNHEPVKEIVSSLPTSNISEGDRYILINTIKERRGTLWVDDPASYGDIVYNIENNKFYKYQGSEWVGASVMSGDKGITIDEKGDLVHSNSITPTSSAEPKLYSIKLDSQGHISEYREAKGSDFPPIDLSNSEGIIGYENLPIASINSETGIVTPGIVFPGNGTELNSEGTLGVSYLRSYDSESVIPNTFSDSGMKFYSTTRSGLGLGHSGTEKLDILVLSKNPETPEGTVDSYSNLTSALIVSREEVGGLYFAQGEYGSNSWSHMTKLGVQVTVGNSDPTDDQLNSMKDGDYYLYEGAYEV